MFDTTTLLQQILLFLSFVTAGLLCFIFYPAIVNYRKCRSNNGNIITLTTMTVVMEQHTTSSSIHKIEYELDTNFHKIQNGIVDDDTTVIVDIDEDMLVSQLPILSIVIPAYDEEQRLPTMLQTAFTYLHQNSCPAMEDLISIIDISSSSSSSSTRSTTQTTNKSCNIEWIVVNDGSRDQTSLAYERFIQQHAASSSNSTNIRMHWKLVSFSKNCGKGAAVQAGMMIATGRFRLMVDADGATDFGPGLAVLIQQLKQEVILLTERTVPSPQQQQQHEHPTNETMIQYPIIFGSRAHLHQQPSSSPSSSSST